MAWKPLIAIAAATLAASLAAAPGDIGAPIEWTISPRQSDGDQRVQLALSYRHPGGGQNTNSRSYSLAELQGLSPAALASSQGTPARFRLVREAGTLDCDGIVRQGRGTGECSFAADARFAAELERRG